MHSLEIWAWYILFQLKKFGFTNIDALEPSSDMIKDAEEKKLYANYYKQFLTDTALPIPERAY